MNNEETLKTAAALRESEQKYRFLVETTNTGFVILDDHGRVLDANAEYVRLSGHATLQDIIGRSVVEWTAEHDRDRNAGEVKKCFEQGFVRNLEIDYEHPDCTFVPIEINATVMDSGHDMRILTLCRDITERRKTEKALRTSEASYRSVFDNANDAIVVHDYMTGAILDVNRKMSEMFGYSVEEARGLQIEDISSGVGPYTQENAIFWIHKAHDDIPQLFEWQCKDRSGKLFWVEVNLKHTSIGGLDAILAIVRDITDRKKTEEAIRVSEEKFAKTFRLSPDVMVITARETGFIADANDRMLEVLGYSRDELIGKTTLAFNVWVDPSERERYMTALSREGSVRNMEVRLRTKSGDIIDVLLSGEKLYLHDGQFVLSTIRDITERKSAEEKLRESETKYRLLFEQANDGIFILDKSGFIDCNQKGAEMFGLSKADIIGNLPSTFSPERQPNGRLSSELEVEQVNAAFRGVTQTFEWQTLHADGTLFDVEVTLNRLELGGKTCVQAIVRDMRERKRLEQEILKSQKLESIGILAGGLAHDFNNLLQGIFGYIAMAKMTINDKEQSLEMLNQAEDALKQSVSLTTQLLTFSKGGKPIKKRIEIMPVIDNAAKFALSGSRSSLRLDGESGLSQVVADEGQIRQVIQNIVLNAKQAMPEGGEVVIRASNVLKPDSKHPQLPEGSYVEICVQDNGIGIPGKNLQKIFDPYFTTRDNGSGLGLATSYSIIKNHGGLIDVSSELGKGSTFCVYLPAEKTEEKVEPQPASSSSARRGKVLVMDDEKLVRDIAAKLIDALGHEVEFAENGTVAIEKYSAASESGRSFDVVILDLTVRGGMGGKETIERLRKIDPEVKAVVSSGYSDDAVIADYQKYGFKACLAKPYRLTALQETLNELFKY